MAIWFESGTSDGSGQRWSSSRQHASGMAALAVEQQGGSSWSMVLAVVSCVCDNQQAGQAPINIDHGAWRRECHAQNSLAKSLTVIVGVATSLVFLFEESWYGLLVITNNYGYIHLSGI